MQSETKELRAGLVSAVAAHAMWGVFPLFWQLTASVDPLTVVCHRVLWAFLTLALCFPLLLRMLTPSARSDFWQNLRRRKLWLAYSGAAILIAINWLAFIWAVNNERVLDASLGYYINPLFNVFLGVLVLREKLSVQQWVAIAVAGLGVCIMTIAGGGLPWVSLILASSFATYGLVKKRAPLPALLGLLIETTVLLLPAFSFILVVESGALAGPNQTGFSGAFSAGDSWILFVLFLGGTITILPLWFFAYAAKRVPLSMLGILQYIGPTIQFVIGSWVLKEDIDKWRLQGFACVWLALLIYMLSLRKKAPKSARQAAE